MTILDRYLLRQFLVAYFICMTSTVGLYIVIDFFANADEFIEDHAGAVVFIRRASKFYFIHSFEYFGRLSPIITMIAAMTSLASLHRHNEVVAILAAGIPTRRALAPILVGVAGVIALGVANREWMLPAHSQILQRLHDDIEANHTLYPTSQIDEDRVLLRAQEAHREDLSLWMVNITLPVEVAGRLRELRADRAYHRRDPETGQLGWLLAQPKPPLSKSNEKIRVLPNGDVFLRSSVSFARMIRQRSWKVYASTSDLVRELHDERAKQPQQLRTMIHNRLMQPLLNFLLVLIGVPFVLRWDLRNVYRGIAVAMVLGAMFFLVDATSGYFSTYGYVDPVTAAWIPVFLFGPLSLALLHRIST